MNTATAIKESLTAAEVARRYGFDPDRSGFIRCPFHRGDNHGSLKLYPGQKGWHCFGCNRGGSVIDFVMELFGIGFTQAVVRINADFSLGLTAERPRPSQQSKALQERRKAQCEAERRRAEYLALAQEHCYWLEVSKVFAPTGPEFIHPLYAGAVKQLPLLEWVTEERLMNQEALPPLEAELERQLLEQFEGVQR